MAVIDRLRSIDPPWVHLLVLAPGEQPESVLESPPGFVVRTIDGRRSRTKGALMTELARSLEFPPGSGQNWDAIEERLADLEWLPAAGYLVTVADAHELLATSPDDYDTFIEIMQTVAKEWATPRRGEWPRPAVPFHVCLAVSLEGLGARSAWRVPRLATARRMR